MTDTIAELKAEKDELIASIQDIESQLALKDKHDEDGRRLSDHEYHEWRGKAVAARRHLLKELREVKAELEKDQQQRTAIEKGRLERIETKLDLLIAHFDV